MDTAYNQNSQHSRRHNRSSTSLSALSLAPLTSSLPIDGADEPHIPHRPRSPHRVSYIETPSVPLSPGILSSSRSPSRSSSRRPLRSSNLPKSKSSTHIPTHPHANLQAAHHRHKSGAQTPNPRPTHLPKHKPAASADFSFFTRNERNDDDWLLRTGSLISSASRESKGQAWLVSRASSTSLTAPNGDYSDSDATDEDDATTEYRLARGSRRASQDADDEFSPVTMRSFTAHSRSASRFNSRVHSRVRSRRGSKAGLALTPSQQAQERDGYFPRDAVGDFAKPDFVDVDEEGEADAESQALRDEALVRRMAKTGTLGLGTWVERLMGWSLFAVEEDGETDVEGTEGETTDSDGEDRRESRKERERQRWKEMLEMEAKEKGLVLPPPPMGSEDGGWGDAAWLLSVATKVLL